MAIWNHGSGVAWALGRCHLRLLGAPRRCTQALRLSQDAPCSLSLVSSYTERDMLARTSAGMPQSIAGICRYPPLWVAAVPEGLRARLGSCLKASTHTILSVCLAVWHWTPYLFPLLALPEVLLKYLRSSYLSWLWSH